MIRPIIVAAFLALLATPCSSHAQPAENPAGTSEGSEQQVTDPASTGTAGAEPVDSDVMYRVFAGEILGGEGDLEGAAGEYLEAAMESDDPAIAMRATRVAIAAEAWQQASMAADRWAQLDPVNIPARESAAIAMLASADYVGAEIHLQQLLALSPEKADAWNLVSRLLAKSPSPEKATKVLDRLLAEQGAEGSAVGYFARSQLAVKTGDFDSAYQFAQTAAKLEPGEVEYLSWAGRLALNREDKKAGLEYFRLAWEASPDDHDLTLAYADLLARDGQADAARALLQDMEQAPDVLLTRILFEIAANQAEEANRLYTEFQALTFEDASKKAFYLAQAAEALDFLQDAIDFYGQVGEGDLYITALARRADLMAMKGDIDGAESVLATLRQNPDPAIVEQAWLVESRIFQQAGETRRALESLDKALVQFGDSIPIRYAHSLVAAQLGLVDLAEADLRLVLAQDPDNATALNALGYTLADQTDRYAEAEELIQRAYELQPDDASIIDSMGWVAYRLGRLEEAEGFLARAWELSENAEIAAHLGEVLWRLGRLDEARAVWNKGLASDPENAVLAATIERLDDGR